MRDIFEKTFGNFSVALRAIALSVVLLLCGCKSEDEIEDNEAQRDSIISYLKGSHVPKLISEIDRVNSYDTDPPFYSTYGDYAFRYIDDYYNSDRESKQKIRNGSRVTLTFRLYEFLGTAIAANNLPAYTNDPSYKPLYEEAGLTINSAVWPFLPLTITIGESEELEGIHTGLIGCVEGDTIELYMTRNMGYGKGVIGLIDQWASLAVFCEISRVQ